MELKIGIIHASREIELEVDDSAQTAQMAEKALEEGTRFIWFVDKKGRRIGVVSDKLSYLEFSGDDQERVVGFGLGA
jgi:uncharacterized protein DUF3107